MPWYQSRYQRSSPGPVWTTYLLAVPAGIKPIEGHPGYYRRPGAKTVYFRVGQNGDRHWRKAENLPKAKTRREELQTDYRRGLISPDANMLFPDYARRLMKTYNGRTNAGFREETRDDYREALERDAFVFFERTKIGEIAKSPQLVTEFYAWVAKRGKVCRSCRDKPTKRAKCENCGGTGRKGELSQNAIRLAAAPFKIVMQVAFEQGVIPRNSAAGVRLPAAVKTQEQILEEDEEDEGDVKALRREQLRAVLDLVRRRYPYWLLFIELLLELGLRIGEAVELRWRDVEFEPWVVGENGERHRYEGAIVRVRRRWYRGTIGPPKSSYGKRKLKLAPAKARKLREHHEQELAAGRGKPNDLVFTTPVEHVRIDQGNLARDMLHPVRDALGIPWLTWHTFRHTAITARFLEGWNAVQCQRFAGHHDPAFTISRYVHLLPKDLPDPKPLTELAPVVQEAAA